MEGKAVKSILKFGKILGVVPFQLKLGKRTHNTAGFSAALAIVLLVLSADVFGSMIFTTNVPAYTVASRLLISIYTKFVYIVACWVRLAFLMKWPAITNLLQTLHKLSTCGINTNSTNCRNNSVPPRFQRATKIFLALISTLVVHHVVYTSILFFQDRKMHLSGVNRTLIIPNVKSVVMAIAFSCRTLNGCSIAFSGLLYTLVLLYVCSENHKAVSRLEKFSRNNFIMSARAESDKELMQILRQFYSLRRCVFDLNDISEAVCFPFVLCQALLSFNFISCTVTEGCAYPRIIEFYRLMQPLMLLMLVLCAGSFVEKQVRF